MGRQKGRESDFRPHAVVSWSPDHDTPSRRGRETEPEQCYSTSYPAAFFDSLAAGSVVWTRNLSERKCCLTRMRATRRRCRM